MKSFLTTDEAKHLRREKQVFQEYFRLVLRQCFETLGIEWDKNKVQKEKDTHEIRHYIETMEGRFLAHTIFLQNGEMLISPSIQQKMGNEKLHHLLDVVEKLFNPTTPRKNPL